LHEINLYLHVIILLSHSKFQEFYNYLFIPSQINDLILFNFRLPLIYIRKIKVV